jgi:hypothetical protein
MTSMMTLGFFELHAILCQYRLTLTRPNVWWAPLLARPWLLTEFDRTSRMWVRKIRLVSLITARSGGRGSRSADTWTARSALPFPLRSEWLGSTVIFQE